MKILVTGGAGFIGSHIVDAYISQGYSVTILDNFSTGKKRNVNPRAKVIKADLSQPGWEKKLGSTRFDVVNHHAAQIDVRKSVDDPVFDAQTNILGTLRLLEYCVRTKVKKVIFASTGGAIYGEIPKGSAVETRAVFPLSPYAIAKYTVENYLRFYNEIHGLLYTVLRYGNVYGPRQDPHGEAGVIAIFFGALKAGKTPMIFGDGSQMRDYVFVGDVARANLKALSPKFQGIFNIGTGRPTSVGELYDLIASFFTGAPAAKNMPGRPGELQRSVLNWGKAHLAWGWKPLVDLQKGVQRVYDSLMESE